MRFRVLKYDELEPGSLRPAFERVCDALARGDFRAAQVKKLRPHPYYRAELSARDRLLFAIGSAEGAPAVLLLELIENHRYDKSRFLRGAVVDEARLVPVEAPDPEPPRPEMVLPVCPAERREFHLLDRALAFDEEQEAALHTPLPLILVGAAGSGKTVLL